MTVRVSISRTVLMLTLLAGGGCSHEPQAAAAAPMAMATTAAANADPAAVPHGDHNPHHRGIVFMHGDMHFEVVLNRTGHHQIYFSDAVRADLPASVATAVTIVVTRSDGRPETLAARIDDAGESWMTDGKPVEAGDATARISFSTSEGPYWIDTPFVSSGP